MWLINTTTLELEAFQQCPVNTYAILSHTWGPGDEELNYDEFKAGEGRHKPGFQKIERCCKLARDNGLHYAWVDTCCIDKRSSAELSEAINSMFNWYESAKECYVYLADVNCYNPTGPLTSDEVLDSFLRSRWFTRGWTLQELIAPKVVSFYAQDWRFIENRQNLTQDLHTATGIDLEVLTSEKNFKDCSIAQRMSWASRRKTTRLEDLAYSLLGLFDVNMPLLYGEGSKAFLRLQEELIRHTNDETIFAWTGGDQESSGLLAPTPSCFFDSANIHQSTKGRERPHLEMTNRGLKLECQMLPCEMNTYVVTLQCERRQSDMDAYQIVIFICRTLKDDQYRRVSLRGRWTDMATDWEISKARISTVFVPDDTQSVDLAPRGGQPLLSVKSSLYSWQFPEYKSRESPQMDDITAYGSETTPSHISAEKPNLTTVIQSRTNPRNRLGYDLYTINSGRTDDIEPEIRLWTPRKINAIQFQFRHLEKGVTVAFTRLDTWRKKFYYHLEIGFDMDFTPVCILYARPFKLANEIRLSDSVLLDFWLRQSLSYLPLWGNFWNHKGCDRLAGCSAVEQSPKMERYKACCLKLSSSWYPTIRGIGCLGLHLMRRHRWLSGCDGVWITEGNRIDGLEMSINDTLPRSYGCVDMHLSLRPLQGLYWELEVQEVPLHSRPGRRGAICYQRIKITALRAIRQQMTFLVFPCLAMFCFTPLLTVLVATWFSNLFDISTIEALPFVIFNILAPTIVVVIARFLHLKNQEYWGSQRPSLNDSKRNHTL